MTAEAVLALLPVPVLLYIIYTDLHDLRIPNWSIGVLAVLVGVTEVPFLGAEEIIRRLVVATIVFGICFALFGRTLLGGGDVKLLPVVLLYIPFERLALYVFALSFCIIVTLTIIKAVRKVSAGSLPEWRGFCDKARYPLGPAIALSALLYNQIEPLALALVAG